MCLIGQHQVFEDGEELFSELLGIAVSGKQIQRVSKHYRQALEAQEQEPIISSESARL